MSRARFAPVAVVVHLLGCNPLQTDVSVVCAEPDDAGRYTLTAYGEECGGDHRGAEVTCDLTGDGASYDVTTSSRDGRDPDKQCASALTAACGTVDASTGDVTVYYAGETLTLTADGTETLCLPSGATGPSDTGP